MEKNTEILNDLRILLETSSNDEEKKIIEKKIRKFEKLYDVQKKRNSYYKFDVSEIINKCKEILKSL